MSPEPTLAFIYDRHATTVAAALDERIARCRRYAAEQGWTVAGEWVDRGDHALTDAPRPQWVALTLAMRQAAAPAVCLIDTWDRISRDRARRAVLRRVVNLAHGHCVTTVGETDRDLATGRSIAAAPGVEGAAVNADEEPAAPRRLPLEGRPRRWPEPFNQRPALASLGDGPDWRGYPPGSRRPSTAT